MTRGLTILRGHALANVTASNGNGAQFLRTPEPKEVWQAAATGTASIFVDLGQAVQLDTIFLGFTNSAAAATWAIRRTTSMAGANAVQILADETLSLPESDDVRVHGLAWLAAPVTTRYLRIDVTQPAGAAALQAGVLIVGERFEHPYEWKSGRRPIDLSERIDLAGGGFGFGSGAIKSSFRCTVADLDEEEVRTLWRLVKKVGTQEAIVLVEGGDGEIEHDQLHYGVFERFEAYERENPADTRWALSMQDWV